MYGLRIFRSSRYRDSAIKQVNFRVLSFGRSSTSAILPRYDHIIRCVIQQASEFRGYAPLSSIEALQVVDYEKDQYYKPHYDWGVANDSRSDRVS
jgi:hypothetical protein